MLAQHLLMICHDTGREYSLQRACKKDTSSSSNTTGGPTAEFSLSALAARRCCS